MEKAGDLLSEKERPEKEEVERALSLGAAQPLKAALAALDTLFIEKAMHDDVR